MEVAVWVGAVDFDGFFLGNNPVILRLDVFPAVRAPNDLFRELPDKLFFLILIAIDIILEFVGRNAASNPEADGNLTFPILFRILLSDHVHCNDKLQQPVALLRRKEAQRVAHDHSHAAVLLVFPLIRGGQPSVSDREGDKPKVGLRLSTARWKVQQVHVLTILRFRVDNSIEVQEDESDLERTPLAMIFLYKVPKAAVGLPVLL